MNVWVVWATLAGNVQNPVVSSVGNFKGISAGDRVDAQYNCTATVLPAEIVTDADRPKLSGKNETAPPGGNRIDGAPLKNGADKKWDISRRLKSTLNSNVNPPFPPQFLTNDKTFPKPQDPLVGNDDASTQDETNDPYANNRKLTSSDPVQRGYGFAGGDTTSTHNLKLEFEEFVRLEINKKWFIVSSNDNWEVHFKFKKEKVDETELGVDVNGDGNVGGPINEASPGQDLNLDGDTVDDITRWVDNGSISAN